MTPRNWPEKPKWRDHIKRVEVKDLYVIETKRIKDLEVEKWKLWSVAQEDIAGWIC